MKENGFLYYTMVSIILIITLLSFHQSHSVKEIAINDNGEIITMVSAAAHVSDLLQEKDIILAPGDQVVPAAAEPLETGMVVEITRAAAVKLIYPQEQKIYYTLQETVGAFLGELSLSPENCLLVSPSLYTPIHSGMEITLVPYEITTEKVRENIPYQVESIEDATIEQGRRIILQEGQEGIRELAYRVYFLDNEELYRELVADTIIVEPMNAVTALGTKFRSPVTIASREKTKMAYAQEGIASWYGAKFHGNRTTNGEIYDKNKFTAAHLTLPFNTLVRVTFHRTGKDVIVRINDRGPHIRGRIIDLSRAAAEEIGLRPHGVGKVSVEVVGSAR